MLLNFFFFEYRGEKILLGDGLSMIIMIIMFSLVLNSPKCKMKCRTGPEPGKVGFVIYAKLWLDL